MGRHAYLIMAHHKFEILAEILKDIDNPRNDIVLHIDKKATGIDITSLLMCVKNARLILLERMDVHWGGASQIQCILNLLECASNLDVHDYYHFMVGVEFPLKSQSYIHIFFDQNRGKEFIGYDNRHVEYLERIKYIHFFNEYGRPHNFVEQKLNSIRKRLLFIQKLFKIVHIPATLSVYKKGDANWSITHDLVLYILSLRKSIEETYKYSFCGDELFIHTIVYNSSFWDAVYNKEDEYASCMRLHQWRDGCNNQYHICDVDYLLASDRLFARKIDGEDALEVINAIRNGRY